MATKRVVVMRKCYEVCQKDLLRHSGRKNSKKYEIKLIAMFLYGVVFRSGYRGGTTPLINFYFQQSNRDVFFKL